jgi:predicted dehydrogenase
MMKVLVVGLGSIGQRHTRLLAAQGEYVVDACDELPAARERLGDLAINKFFSSYKEALQSKPDVVFLCSPTPYHVAHVMTALEAGCHVFCEKPLTYSLAEGNRLLERMHGSDRHVNIGFHLHFHKGLMEMKRIIGEGLIGEVLQVDARVGTYITLKNSVTRYQREQKGSLFGDYTHQFDLLYWLTGRKPEKMLVLAAEREGVELSSDPNIADILFRFRDPMQAHIHLNYIQMPQRHLYEITGTKGWLFLDADHMYMDIGLSIDQSSVRVSFEQERDDIYKAEHRCFFDAIAAGARQETTVEDAMVSTAMYETAMGAYRSGNWQEIVYAL